MFGKKLALKEGTHVFATKKNGANYDQQLIWNAEIEKELTELEKK